MLRRNSSELTVDTVNSTTITVRQPLVITGIYQRHTLLGWNFSYMLFFEES